MEVWWDLRATLNMWRGGREKWHLDRHIHDGRRMDFVRWAECAPALPTHLRQCLRATAPHRLNGMSGTLKPYLAQVRAALDVALCLRNFPSQVVRGASWRGVMGVADARAPPCT